MTLKQQLLIAGLGLSETDFSTHESDLYVYARDGVWEWLQANYAFPKQCVPFMSGDAPFIEVHFGYMDEFVAAKKVSRVVPVDVDGSTAEDRRQLAAHGIAWGD